MSCLQPVTLKTIIAGSRGHYPTKEEISKGIRWYVSEVVSGGARGADECGEHWAQANGIPVNVFEPDWDTHGKAAGPIRNRKMAEYADALLAFWDGKSRGTKNMIDEAIHCGLLIKVVRVPAYTTS